MSDDLDKLRSQMAALSGKSGRKRLAVQREPDTSLKKMDRRKARKRSVVKGSNFERKVAKMFAEWSGFVVKRTPKSGGWSGSAAFGVSGDLVASSKRFPFHVECKNREDWQLDDLITGTRAKDERSIVEWWRQTVRDCPQVKGKKGYISFQKEPLLVFKRNAKHPLVMVREDWLRRYFSADHIAVDGYRILMACVPQFTTTLHDVPGGDTVVVIMRLDKFLAIEPPPRKRKEKSQCTP